MEISLRDERGQAFIEYILVLVVAVAIILGGIYQLNSAFKVWANNYFGDYLSCLLETGELPAISGTGGDAGICNQAFKPFSLADGRPLRTGAAKRQETTAGGGGGGQRERPTARSGGGAAFIARSSTPFGRGQQRTGQSGKGKSSMKTGSTYTGNTTASSYGGYTGTQRQTPPRQTRLDTKFAFEDQSEKLRRRTVSSIKSPRPSEAGGRQPGIKFRQRIATKSAPNDTDGSGFTFSIFLRYLIIAAIIIAILVFLGGQGLQIGKSMDGGR